MDTNWFDTLTKAVSRPGSRRGLVRLVAVLPLAGAVGRLLGPSSGAAGDVSAENCTPAGKRCGGGKRQQPCKKCCTKNVITDQNGRKRCSCVRLGNSCSNDSQCCEGICKSGTCQVTPACVPLQDTCAAGDACCAGTCDASLNVCCLATNATGCTEDLDCCDATAVCVDGTCEIGWQQATLYLDPYHQLGCDGFGPPPPTTRGYANYRVVNDEVVVNVHLQDAQPNTTYPVFHRCKTGGGSVTTDRRGAGTTTFSYAHDPFDSPTGLDLYGPDPEYIDSGPFLL